MPEELLSELLDEYVIPRTGREPVKRTNTSIMSTPAATPDSLTMRGDVETTYFDIHFFRIQCMYDG
jgi:hypothetical protein